jgi:hypothetical protein
MGGRPLDAREGRRQAAQQVEQAKKVGKERERWTLARCARDYHERVIETSRTTKHAVQWIGSLEHHVPDALWHKSIAEIDAPELLAALTQVRSLEDKERRIPETLQCVRQRLDAVFEEGLFHKRCTSGAARRDQPDASPRAALRAGGTRAQPHRTHEAGGRQVIALKGFRSQGGATLRAGVALWDGTLYRSDADNGAPMWVVSRWAMAAFRLELDQQNCTLAASSSTRVCSSRMTTTGNEDALQQVSLSCTMCRSPNPPRGCAERHCRFRAWVLRDGEQHDVPANRLEGCLHLPIGFRWSTVLHDEPSCRFVGGSVDSADIDARTADPCQSLAQR